MHSIFCFDFDTGPSVLIPGKPERFYSFEKNVDIMRISLTPETQRRKLQIASRSEKGQTNNDFSID